MKQCALCLQFKNPEEFRKQSKARDGLKSYCKTCDSNKSKQLYNKNKETRITQILNWQKNNIDKVHDYSKKYKHKVAENKIQKSP